MYPDNLQELREKARCGDADAQYEFGMRFEDGSGVLQNDKLAVEWYRKAANQGHPDALFALGEMYSSGCGVRQNIQVALQCYRKAAELGHKRASKLLDERNEEHLAQGLRESAENGNRNAQYQLATFYMERAEQTGSQQDYKQAAKWYGKSAAQGDTKSLHALKLMTEQNRYGAFQELCLVAEQGHAEPLRHMAEQGDPDAQYHLAQIYQEGRGVPQDKKLAIEMYSNAAAQGHVKSVQDLCRLIEQGDEIVLQRLQKMAEQGDKKVWKVLCQIIEQNNMSFISGRYGTIGAIYLVRKMAQHGNMDATRLLSNQLDKINNSAWFLPFLSTIQFGNLFSDLWIHDCFKAALIGHKDSLNALKYLAERGDVKAKNMLKCLEE